MRRTLALIGVMALLAGACGDDDGGATTTSAPTSTSLTPTTTAAPAPSTTAATSSGGGLAVAASDLGDILVDGEGRTLYLFTPDDGGPSVCYDDCEAAWPPFYDEDLGTPDDGVDVSLLGSAARDDGTVQATYGGWPLYYFAGDTAPGDTNGQGVNDVWYVIGPDGVGIGAPTAAAGLSLATSDLGDILVDGEGRTLYLFTPDDGGASTCYDQCEANWPPLYEDDLRTPGDGVDASLLGTAPRDDGTVQVTYGGWPLYYFAGDEAPGDTNGQALNDVWWVVSASGEAIGG